MSKRKSLTLNVDLLIFKNTFNIKKHWHLWKKMRTAIYTEVALKEDDNIVYKQRISVSSMLNKLGIFCSGNGISPNSQRTPKDW